MATSQNRVVRNGAEAQSDRGGGPGDDSCLGDFSGSGNMKVGGLAKRVAELDLVDVEVAPNDDEHELAVGDVEHGLQCLGRRYVEEVGQLIDCANAGCVDLFGRLGVLVRQRRLEEFGLLRVGGVVASRANDDRILASVGD